MDGTTFAQHKNKFSKSYSGQQDTRDCKCQSFTTTTKKPHTNRQDKEENNVSFLKNGYVQILLLKI